MNDASSNRSSVLNNVRNAVDGYDGYEQSDLRSRSDAAFRKVMGQGIQNVFKLFGDDVQLATKEKQVRLDNLSSHVSRSLQTLDKSLANPTYFNSSFFLGHSSSRFYQQIYKLENQMLEFLKSINEEGQSLVASNFNSESFEDDFMRIQDSIDGFSQALFEREALMSGHVY